VGRKSPNSRAYFPLRFVADAGGRRSICRRGMAAIALAGVMPFLLGFAVPGVSAAKQPARETAGAPSQKPLGEYIISPSDVLDVSVWKEPDISRTVTVRPDGKISLPLLGEMVASGKSPVELQAVIKEKLQRYIVSPEVTVLLHDVKNGAVSILGKVSKPGAYPVAQQMTVLDLIAAAGGFKDYAKLSKIYVLRVDTGGATVRYKFNFKEVIKGRNLSQNIALLPRDTVYVP